MIYHYHPLSAAVARVYRGKYYRRVRDRLAYDSFAECRKVHKGWGPYLVSGRRIGAV